MKWNERRSYASRAYRATLHSRTLTRVLTVGLCAWTVVAFAAIPLAPPTEPQSTEAAMYWRFFMAALAAVVGIVTLFGAGLALGARWVAEPAAAKMLKGHVDAGAAAHEALVSRHEWDEGMKEFRRDVAELTKIVLTIPGAKRR